MGCNYRYHLWRDNASGSKEACFDWLLYCQGAPTSSQHSPTVVNRCIHGRLLDVKNSLHMARSRVVLPLDSWSALNSLSLFGVFRYWLGKDRSLKMALLGLRAMRGLIDADVGK